MAPYKQLADEWLEEAPYSAIRVLKKLREMGFDGGYSIVKTYASRRKMDLDEKATVRFEIMTGKQGQMDWGFFEDHQVYEDEKWKKLYCFLRIQGVFESAIYRVCNRYEYKHDDSVPSECIAVFRRKFCTATCSR